MQRIVGLAVAAMLAAAPAAATVTFNGVKLYSGSATSLVGAQNVVSPQINSTTPGNFSITNDNSQAISGASASVHTVMAVENSPSGVRFRLDGRATATYSGNPQYITPNAASDNQYRYSFSTDTPFHLFMTYNMPFDTPQNYGTTSDYYTLVARFEAVTVCGGAMSLPFNCLSTPDLVQYPRNLRQTDFDKTISIDLLPGVYTITIFGNISAQTYHPGAVYAGTQGLFTTNINPVAGVPEPANWAMLITGFGLAGAALRRRRHQGMVSPL